MKKQDYRIFAKNPKQNFVFKLLLDYINTDRLECYSDRIRNHVMELFNNYKAGKLSKHQIESRLTYGQKQQRFGSVVCVVTATRGYQIIENPNFRDNSTKKYTLYAYLDVLAAKDENIDRIFSAGVNAYRHGHFQKTCDVAGNRNRIILRVKTNVKPQKCRGISNSYCYGSEIIDPKDIMSLTFSDHLTY